MSDLVERLRKWADHMEAYDPGTDDEIDIMRAAADALERQQWVSVAERLPEPETDDLYVVWYEGDYEFAFYRNPGWDSPDSGWIDKGVTHWIPLPEPPQD